MHKRPIKFRVWLPAKQPDEVFVLGSKAYMTYQGTPDLETLQSFMFHYGNAEHLMQFTGVLDRSGKEIYEGDVVKWSTIDTDDDGEPISRELVSSVVYSGHGFWIECESFGWEGEGLWNWKEMEVIGNIYENPELIP